MALVQRSLHWVDWVIFALTLVVSLGIGLYHALTGGKQKTTKEYLMGNRQLQVIPVSMSIFMSVISAIYILGTTAEVYTHGPQLILQTLGSLIGYVLSTLIFVPLFYPLKLTSAFEYIDQRFRSRPLRLLCVFTLIVQQVSYMGLAMYAPATALEGVTGFPVWGSIIIAGVVTNIYTTLGGMKAVVWTDVFQGFVLFSGVVIVTVLGTIRVGGPSEVWEIARRGGRLKFFDFSIDPTKRMNFWPVVIGRAFYIMSHVGTNQTAVQRYCALPSLRKAKIALVIGSVYYCILALLVGFCGLAMYAYFAKEGCDPLRGQIITNSNQLLPYFIITVLEYPGLTGLFLAVLFSGALSSLSSSMNSLSAVTWKDVIEPRFKVHKEEYKAYITKILVFIYGVLAIGMSFLMQTLSGHVMQISSRVVGSLSGPIKGVMILGSLVPCSNAIGCFVGSAASFALTLWMNIGSYITRPHRYRLPTDVTNCTFSANETALPVPTDPPRDSIFALYRVSFTWMPVVASLSVIIVGIITSLLTGGQNVSKIKTGLVLPLSNYICCCCPESVRRFLWCGMDHDRADITDAEEEDDDEEERKIRLLEQSDVTGDHVTETKHGADTGVMMTSSERGRVLVIPL